MTRQITIARRPVGMPDEETWAVVETAVPTPGDGEFVVAVDHISLDPTMRGWLRDRRSYLPPLQIGDVMRALGTGVVIDSRHPGFGVGTAVSGMFGVTEHAISDGRGVRIIDTDVAGPETWLGALGMTGLTAHHGLFEVGDLREGDTVVVSAAAGAVGSVAGQIAKAHGCTVIGIAGGPQKCAWLLELGFDGAIDHKNDDVARRLAELVPDGIDVYFDNVGGEILDIALTHLRRGARIVVCGGIAAYNDEAPSPGPANYLNLIVFRARMQGFLVFDYPDKDAAAISALQSMIADGRLVARETVVDGDITDFGSVLLRLFTGDNIGKLVLRIS